jgi:hypothetical protein
MHISIIELNVGCRNLIFGKQKKNLNIKSLYYIRWIKINHTFYGRENSIQTSPKVFLRRNILQLT